MSEYNLEEHLREIMGRLNPERIREVWGAVLLERIAELERAACGKDLLLRDAEDLAAHWRTQAGQLEARLVRAGAERDRMLADVRDELGKAEAKIAELEGILQSHEIVLSQTAERAQSLEAELKAANEYRDMWKAMAEAQDARAQKAEAENANLLGVIEIWQREVAGRDADIDGLRAEVARIANDYTPDNDGQASLALRELRESLRNLLPNAGAVIAQMCARDNE